MFVFNLLKVKQVKGEANGSPVLGRVVRCGQQGGGEETAAKSKQRVQALRIERMGIDGSLFE